MLKKTLESPLECKDIQLVYPKGNQSWIFIGRTDAKAETPILWPPDAKNWLIWKDPDDGKDWRQEEKGTTEDVMVGWHHQLEWHEFEQASGIGGGQGSLVCCNPWDRKELDMTEWLNVNWICGSLLTTSLTILWIYHICIFIRWWIPFTKFLIFMNNATMNIQEHIFAWIDVLFSIRFVPRSGIVGSYVR